MVTKLWTPGRSPMPPASVALCGAFCITILWLISFVGGQGGPKDYVIEVSISLGNLLI